MILFSMIDCVNKQRQKDTTELKERIAALEVKAEQNAISEQEREVLAKLIKEEEEAKAELERLGEIGVSNKKHKENVEKLQDASQELHNYIK